MHQKERKTSQVIRGFLVVVVALSISSCTKTIVKETEYASDKQISYKSTTVDNKVIYELRKVFQKTSALVLTWRLPSWQHRYRQRFGPKVSFTTIKT
jgi:hypothetical protein